MEKKRTAEDLADILDREQVTKLLAWDGGQTAQPTGEKDREDSILDVTGPFVVVPR